MIKSPITTLKTNNPYVGKKIGNSEKVKELLTKIKNTEDTVQTLQNKILKREEKMPKNKSEVPEFKPKVKKPVVDSLGKKMKVSLSTTFQSPTIKKPKITDLPMSPAKHITTSMNYMKRENSIRAGGSFIKKTTIEKKNAQSFVSANKTTTKKVKKPAIDDSPASRKKSMSTHLMYGMFSPDKRVKSPVAKRKKSVGIIGTAKKQPSKYWNQSYMAGMSPKRTAKTP